MRQIALRFARSTARDAGGSLDLSETWDVPVLLLDDTRAWRQRLVERFVFGSVEHMSVMSSYQCELRPELLQPFLGKTTPERVKILLPLTTRDKRPLLGFNATGHGDAPAQLLPRESIAAIQAEYLHRLVISSPGGPKTRAGLSPNLLEAVCVFTPAIYDLFVTQENEKRDRALRAYLQDGLGYPVPLTDVHRWLETSDAIGTILAQRLQEPADHRSASECILLALPKMEPRPCSTEALDSVLDAFSLAVRDADREDDDSLLMALAEYGRRWEMIVETEVPVAEPFSVKLTEERPLGLKFRGWSRHRFALGDAQSVHLEAKVQDPTTMIADYEVKDLSGRTVGIGPLEAARDTPETLSLYSSDPDRPYYVEVGIRLQPASWVRWSILVVTLIVLAALVGVFTVPESEQLPGELALLVTPTTFAAALLLIREETSLAVRLQAAWRAILAFAVTTLWLAALVRLFQAHA